MNRYEQDGIVIGIDKGALLGMEVELQTAQPQLTNPDAGPIKKHRFPVHGKHPSTSDRKTRGTRWRHHQHN